jgi:hypothetical protein
VRSQDAPENAAAWRERRRQACIRAAVSGAPGIWRTLPGAETAASGWCGLGGRGCGSQGCRQTSPGRPQARHAVPGHRHREDALCLFPVVPSCCCIGRPGIAGSDGRRDRRVTTGSQPGCPAAARAMRRRRWRPRCHTGWVESARDWPLKAFMFRRWTWKARWWQRGAGIGAFSICEANGRAAPCAWLALLPCVRACEPCVGGSLGSDELTDRRALAASKLCRVAVGSDRCALSLRPQGRCRGVVGRRAALPEERAAPAGARPGPPQPHHPR